MSASIWVLLVVMGTMSTDGKDKVELSTYRDEFVSKAECVEAKNTILGSVPKVFTIPSVSPDYEKLDVDKVIIYQAASCYKKGTPEPERK